jgi:hypothetical protein
VDFLHPGDPHPAVPEDERTPEMDYSTKVLVRDGGKQAGLHFAVAVQKHMVVSH